MLSTMLSRFIFKPSHLRYCLTVTSSKTYLSSPRTTFQNPSFPIPNLYFFPKTPHFYSTNNGNKDPPDLWNLSSGSDRTVDSLFSDDSNTFDQSVKLDEDSNWSGGIGTTGVEDDGKSDVFGGAGNEGGGVEEWATAEGYRPWDFAVGDDEKGEDVFGIREEDLGLKGFDDEQKELELSQKNEEDERLRAEEKALTLVLKGPNRAFGDLIAASGITDEMLDSLIALKDLRDIQGLPPLREIEDMRYEKNTRKSTRAEIERQKQEEFARARVREVDTKGRAYGTGRRKCSVARVWIQPGDGKFIVNDKEFDVYFPMLDHRAALLRPFSETKTLGTWNINCTVKGGGVSGQVGAVLLGISRALQNWDPNLRPPLREAGFLTRDSRVVERKKPGKAKARKSFQWVKR